MMQTSAAMLSSSGPRSGGGAAVAYHSDGSSGARIIGASLGSGLDGGAEHEVSADAGGKMPGSHRPQRRDGSGAVGDGVAAARPEGAAGGRIDRARQVAGEHDAL